ncbi:uncharacterized protein LAESUDRAFT_101845 [Laetiporus sulphureus 93-53]|uniref:Uncharacterized protein n=1 Tax=Laetiporus sulphureus 93-53 TaxID=1314785 RepID=A0A165ESX5_9APHY|nr:uncharacterized protein LAESUDRAFT_101845 [Laetiporus sulphureus 93-53]KZT07689.1 hypothetical protein LAESUDRAFT_101845 [Laetiporus sulphureus 93-53]
MTTQRRTVCRASSPQSANNGMPCLANLSNSLASIGTVGLIDNGSSWIGASASRADNRRVPPSDVVREPSKLC